MLSFAALDPDLSLVLSLLQTDTEPYKTLQLYLILFLQLRNGDVNAASPTSV